MLQLPAKPAQLLSRVPRRAWRWIIRISLVVLVFPLILQWVVAYLVGSDARILPPQLLAAKNLLIVTAHPDDECLFFAPSILGVLDRNRGITGALLAMSTGNAVPPFPRLFQVAPSLSRPTPSTERRVQIAPRNDCASC